MQKIKVTFDKQTFEQKKPSEMERCKPFIVINERGKKVAIRTGWNAFIFFSEDGDCSYTREEDKDLVDAQYKVLQGEKATVVLTVE